MSVKIRFFTIHQISPSMSAIIETRHNIMEMLFQLESVEALMKVEQQLREALKHSAVSEDYPLPNEGRSGSVEEPVVDYPDLSASEFQVKDSVDLGEIMAPDGRTSEEIKRDWAELSDVFSHISEEDTKEFIEID